MKQAVLLLAHGAPERLEDVESYVAIVRGGSLNDPRITEELKRRYALIGGGSPLLSRTFAQALALEHALQSRGLQAKVYVGMRNWHPFIRDVMAQMQTDGVERIVAICLAPQYSKRSIGLYFRKVQEARQDLRIKAEIVWTKSFHRHPLLIEAFYEKLAPLLPVSKVLFTAHSLPAKILEEADPYDAEVRSTAEAVAERAHLESWEFAYQSQGMTEEKWLGPNVESCIDRFARDGVREFALVPIGFVSDHVEILYDVDILFRRYALERGIRLLRPESLNDSPTFISALAAVAEERLLAS
jgi:ferrochelatase